MKLPTPIEFEWDKGNVDKKWVKHKVHFKEAEVIFLNKTIKIFPDNKHSKSEKRYLALGKTNSGIQLLVIFTVRYKKIRVISARKQNKKERSIYMKNKRPKQIPKFKNEDEERDFWDKADATDYFDLDHPIDMDLSKLKPTTESISLRLPGFMLMRIKELANARDVPYQSLMKMFLADRIKQELQSSTTAK